MILKVDNREQELIKSIQSTLEQNPQFQSAAITLQIENLPLGDIIIYDDKRPMECAIIERKTLRDLAASIKDKRYNEQSYRLQGYPLHNHQIYYLIEGDFCSVKKTIAHTETSHCKGICSEANEAKTTQSTEGACSVFRDKIDTATLYSAIFSISYFKGFSVLRSKSIEESAYILCNMAFKIDKEDDRWPFYYVRTNTDTNVLVNEDEKDNNSKLDDKTEKLEEGANNIAKNYSAVIKKVKKENITPQNVAEIMLCQIPGVSATIAASIMAKFGTLSSLLESLKQNRECLQGLTFVDNLGKNRRINKTTLQNVVDFLEKQ